MNVLSIIMASFVLADHLAFTLAFEPSYIAPMMVGKIISGLSAILFALLIYKKTKSA